MITVFENFTPHFDNPSEDLCKMLVELSFYFEDLTKVRIFYERVLTDILSQQIEYATIRNMLDFGFISENTGQIVPLEPRSSGYLFKYFHRIKNRQYKGLVELAKQDSLEWYIMEMRKTLTAIHKPNFENHPMYIAAIGEAKIANKLESCKQDINNLITELELNDYSVVIIDRPQTKLNLEKKSIRTLQPIELKEIEDVKKYFTMDRFDL